VVLGRFSTALGAVLLADLLLALASLMHLAVPRLYSGVRRLAGRLPEALVVFLTVVPLPLFLLAWFLFPLPLLEIWTAFAGAVLLCAAPGPLLISCRPGKSPAEAVKAAGLAGASLVLSLLAAELVLRAVTPGSFFNPRLGLVPHARYTIMVDLPGVTRGGTLSTNRWGLRGEEPPEEWDRYLTIVTVGGSTTANYYLDDGKTWSHVLQETIRESRPLTWVGNGGIPMHASEQHDYFLREVVAGIRPDVVVFLTGANDIGQFLRGEAVLLERPLPERGLREWMFRESRLLQILYKLKKVHVDRAPVVAENVDPEFVLLPMPGPDRELPDDLGELLSDPGLYRRRIERLIATCREIGVTPVFLTQPLLFQDDEYWRGIQGGSYWHGGPDSVFSAAANWRMLDYLNRQLIDACREEGVACFDLASKVPHDSEFFYDSMHLTEAGAFLVGRLVGRFMLDSVVTGIP
jgi:lysophospholipase L1-like esterase